MREAGYGHAAREIVKDVPEHDAEIIIMGSRGTGDLAGLVLGSTARKVIHLTDRPVLVVRRRARWRHAGRPRPLEAASFAEDPPAVRGESVQGGIWTGHGLKKP